MLPYVLTQAPPSPTPHPPKLVENLLLAKYLISVALTLMLLFSSGQVQAIFYFHPWCLSTDNIMEKISFNILLSYPKMWHKLSQLAAFV